jgi:SAM-dependent methyltransferase
VGFDVAAPAYDRFMGRFSVQLADQLADLARARAGQRALDVGCGPGALTGALVARVGAGSVAAVDPSASFVAAVRERHPDVEVAEAAAEALPFPDGTFDVVLAQLVVHFMTDPVAGLREMGRVARDGGAVAACVWDHGGDRGPLTAFWRAVRAFDPGARDESDLAGARKGHLAELFAAAGLRELREAELTASVGFESFEAWWEPYTYGIGPAGAYVAGLDAARRERLRAACRELLPPAPFELEAREWAVRGRPQP